MHATLLFIAIFAACSNVLSQGPDQIHCRDNFQAIGDRCYNFSHSQTGWTESLLICQNIGGALATIETEEEQRNVEDALRNDEDKSTCAGWWVGGGNFLQDGWQWVPYRARPMDYTNWRETDFYTATAAPGADEENCVVMCQQSDYKWVNRFCCEIFNFICESEPIFNNNPFSF